MEEVHQILEAAFRDLPWQALRSAPPHEKFLVKHDTNNPGIGQVYEREARRKGNNRS
jgi:hypothetical protein